MFNDVIEHPKNFWDPYLFLQQLKLVTSNLVYNLGPWSSMPKTTFRTKNGVDYGLGRTPETLGCSLIHTPTNFGPESCFWHAIH